MNARRRRSFSPPSSVSPWSVRQLESRILLAGEVGAAVADPPPVAATFQAPPEQSSLSLVQQSAANLVFVSPDVPDVDQLVSGLSGQHELILLDEHRPLLDQVTEIIQSRAIVASIHLVTHGQAGQISLGQQKITIETLEQFEQPIRSWADSLVPGADILLYGCETGAGATGEQFVQRLAQLSRADVAASLDATGDRRQGGDWDLERTTGTIQTDLALSAGLRQNYSGLLPITIHAAGVTNEEQMLLQIDGVTVATFDNIGGNAYGNLFETYTASVDGASADQVRVVFTNDSIDPVTGADRNLRVDKITIDGVDYETEDPSVFSTGTWLPADGLVPGFRQNEFLHADGYFQYADAVPNEGSVIRVIASGSEGEERAELRIDGVAVQSWSNVGTVPQVFTYTAANTVTASQIQVGFTNDLWDPVAGIDRNLIVDSIEIDGQVFQTEDPSVFSTATWLPEDGIVPGFRQSEFLHSNGYFQYADGTPSNGSQILIFASGFEGDENMTLQIDGVNVASWNSVGLAQQSFVHTATDVVTADQIRVVFTNDLYNPAGGIDRNLIVDRITIDAVNYETEAPTVYSTGSWLPEDGIVPGFRESEILNANGYFQFASDPGTVSLDAPVVSVSESELSVTLTLTRSLSNGELSVEYATADGTATDTLDYIADSGVVTFLDGETTSSITITLLPDAIDEPDEDFTVLLSNVTGGATLGNATSTVSIIDDDLPPVPGLLSISPALVAVDEAAGIATLLVTRSGGSDGEVTVSYATSDGTALAGSDYQEATGILSFADGELTKSIDVIITDDAIDEADESLLITLSAVTGGASLGDDVATVTIVDDDQALLNGSPVFQYQEHLYLLTSAEQIWTDAQAEAEALGGNLVTINDADEEDWLRATFGASQSFWIGLQDIQTEGTFVWSSEEPVSYTNWGVGLPDDLGGEDYVEMNFGPSGQWNDRNGAITNFGIIEIGVHLSDGAMVPNGTGFTTETIASGLVQPIAFAEAPDGRIFVNEKAGVVRIIENGQVLATPFLDINLEVNSHHDRGLMGIALDPDFANNGYVYLQYAVELNPADPDANDFNTPAGGRLIRITASAADPNVADLSTRVVIQDNHQMSHATHAVGDVEFDNAGNLIYTWGDGGFDPVLRLSAQDPNSPQGKLFRIDPVTFEGIAQNPHYDPLDPSGIASRVWALGVRNSWKLTVDRATGDVYLGEVTDSGPEEINVMRADGSTILNYGWPYFEDTNRTSYGTVPPNFIYESAFVALPHTNAGGGDAIVGGALWRGDDDIYPEVYDGRYFFGNFNQGILYTADQNGDYQQFGDVGTYSGAVDIQIGSDGHLWVMSLFTGTIERLVYEIPGSSNTDPIAVVSVSSTAGATPMPVTLDASASVDDDGDTLFYAWDFQSDGIVDATGAIVTHAYTAVGRSSTTLIVSDGNGGTDQSVIEIDVLATAPLDGNLAFGRPTIQSETDGAAISSRAVDGNTEGIFSLDSVAQTIRTRTPLWEVDLGAVYDIGSLEIYTRTDGVNPLSNYWILVSENPFSSGNLDAARNDPGVWVYNDIGTADPLESIAVGALGRYVRIQMAGIDDVLALAEVRIFEV